MHVNNGNFYVVKFNFLFSHSIQNDIYCNDKVVIKTYPAVYKLSDEFT